MKNLSFYSIQLGNMLRGATDTSRVGEAYAVVAGGAITIKEPAFYDVSHWKTINNWAGISPHPLLMGTKATEADNYKDPTFPEYFTKMASIVGCRRLAYHFFRKSVDPVRQANWFVDFIMPYITNDDILCLDFEEGGETAKQLWAFLNRVNERRPNNQLIIYSRKNLMDPIVMTASEKTFFKSIPSWPAGYPDNPNLYNSTPSGYIPDQTKWGPVWAWQYTSHGQVAGIDGDTDCNLMEQALIDFCGGTVIEPPIGETMQGKVLAFINIRPSAGSTIADLGDLLQNDVIDYSEKQYISTGTYPGDWYHITKVTRFANGSEVAPPAGVEWWCWGKNIEEIAAPPGVGVADMPYTITFGGDGSPYVETTISGVIPAK